MYDKEIRVLDQLGPIFFVCKKNQHKTEINNNVCVKMDKNYKSTDKQRERYISDISYCLKYCVNVYMGACVRVCAHVCVSHRGGRE